MNGQPNGIGRNITHEDDYEYGRVYHVTDTRNTTYRRQPRSRTLALTECVVTRADGTTYTMSRSARRAKKLTPVATTVVTRHKPLRADITRYIAVADAYHLDAANVARLYRERASNGYHYTNTVETNETHGFHGAEV